jgi:hypothetical protein
MTNLTRRIERLEEAGGGGDGASTYIVVTNSPDEPRDAAIKRYRALHPGAPDKANFIVVVTGFSDAGTSP